MRLLIQEFSVIKELFPNFTSIFSYFELRRALENCKSVLDIGCGPSSPVRLLDLEKKVGIDAHAPSVQKALQKGTHDEVHLCSATEIEAIFGVKSFDCCVALEVIEHFPKEEGYRLLRAMEKVARRKVVISTPNGFLPQRGGAEDFQEHLSGWTTTEMKNLGYSVTGILGHKVLRGERHLLRFRPKALWFVMSLLSHYLYTRRRPQKAAGLLCIKELNCSEVKLPT